MKNPIVSLCLPTYGVEEWVFPVLDSIYSQNVDDSLFEVIVTDNGANENFYKSMTIYKENHPNLIYKKTEAFMFHNQLECLKLASGLFLKFVNHRAAFTENSLNKIIQIVEKNKEDKPVIYFANGSLKKESYVLNNFDDFVATLRRYSSWTTGVGIWKSDYDRIPGDVKIDKISPHSVILFSERNKSRYIVENFIFSKELDSDHSKKGNYDLFKAFGIEEFLITVNLFVDGSISAKTLKIVKKDYRNFLSELYFDFMIRKKPCSYDLTGFNDSMGIFYRKSDIIFHAYLEFFRRLFNKISKKG